MNQNYRNKEFLPFLFSRIPTIWLLPALIWPVIFWVVIGTRMKHFEINWWAIAVSCAAVLVFYVYLQYKSFQNYKAGMVQYKLLMGLPHKLFTNVNGDGYGEGFIDLAQNYKGSKRKYVPFMNCDKTDLIVTHEALYFLTFNTKTFANPFTGFTNPFKASFDVELADTEHLVSYRITGFEISDNGDLFIGLKHSTFPKPMNVVLLGIGHQFKAALRSLKKEL